MRPSGKWIDGIDVEGSVADAARRSLDARLAVVEHFLPRAAYLAEQDVEHVHRLRVGTRRAVAALRLYRDWLPRKPARWMTKRLKQIRRAAGDARDLDVLGQRLTSDYGERAAPVVALITEERATVQPAIVTVAECCRRRDRFVRKTSKLLAGIGMPDGDPLQAVRYRDWAKAQLSAAGGPFFQALPDENADVAALHQFRIRAKALRYTIELVAAPFGPELRSEFYPAIESLQERLGKIQDRVASSARLNQWADDTRHADQQALLRELAAEESARLANAIGEFRGWWTAERADSLKQGFASAVNGGAITESQQVAHQT